MTDPTEDGTYLISRLRGSDIVAAFENGRWRGITMMTVCEIIGWKKIATSSRRSVNGKSFSDWQEVF